jgi:hypothetical protein
MIFIVEHYLKTRSAKIKAWEKARDQWINEKDQYYRSEKDWERRRPYPVMKFNGKKVLTWAITACVVHVAVFGVLWFIQNDSTSNKNSSQVDKKYNPKVGDTVKVAYGDFKDSTGELVKVGEGNAIIKLTNSTYTKEMAMAVNRSPENARNNGELLKIQSLDNLKQHKEAK